MPDWEELNLKLAIIKYVRTAHSRGLFLAFFSLSGNRISCRLRLSLGREEARASTPFLARR